MVSQEKKQRFSELLKHIRGNDGVKEFAARLEIKLPTYSGWETARAFPSDRMWETLLPQLCELSGFTPDNIDRYLRGDYELTDLIEGSARDGLQPRARPVITLAKFRAWLQTLSLAESIQVLKDTAEWIGSLTLSLESKKSSAITTNSPPKNNAIAPPIETTASIEFDSSSPVLETITTESQGSTTGLNNEKITVNTLLQMAENLSLENMVEVEKELHDLIDIKLQDIGSAHRRKYQSNSFYQLLEEYRQENQLSYQQFEEILLKEGKEAGLEQSRVAQIVRGQELPNNRELIWMGVFIKKSDGSLYSYDELVFLRDGKVVTDSNGSNFEEEEHHHSQSNVEGGGISNSHNRSCEYHQ